MKLKIPVPPAEEPGNQVESSSEEEIVLSSEILDNLYSFYKSLESALEANDPLPKFELLFQFIKESLQVHIISQNQYFSSLLLKILGLFVALDLWKPAPNSDKTFLCNPCINQVWLSLGKDKIHARGKPQGKEHYSEATPVNIQDELAVFAYFNGNDESFASSVAWQTIASINHLLSILETCLRALALNLVNNCLIESAWPILDKIDVTILSLSLLNLSLS